MTNVVSADAMEEHKCSINLVFNNKDKHVHVDMATFNIM